MHGWALFLSVFGVIFVAELPDKTALAALVLATRHRPLPVLLGAATALTIQSVVAVGAGEVVSLLPQRPVRVISGVVFIAEWGDLTQLATGAFAARYRSPYWIFGGATLALWAVTAIAVVVGHRAGRMLDARRVKYVAAVVFAVVGVGLMAGVP